MKSFAVLLLCAQLFSCRADLHLVQDANCNDLQIFEAMDLALKKYNSGKKEGNQFALHRITEASTTTEDNSDQQYFVSYETIESSCPVNNGKEWQDCQYRPATEAETGICRAHVYIKKLEKTIISQHCNITSGEGPVISTQYVCLGCPHPIPSNSNDLLPILRRAIQKFNDESNHPKLFKVEEVKKATRQVVAGWVYEIEYTIKETNCFKSESTDLNPHCGIGEVSGTCAASVLVSINSSITSIDQHCRFTDEIVPPPIRRCPGCPVPMEINSTDLVEPLTHSINTFNSENNHTFLYKVGLIHSATKQVVSGMKYVVIFTIELTNCSKEDNDHLHDGCQFDGKDQKRCSSTIHVVPWLKKLTSNVDCSLPITMSATRAGIRGLSPFRSVGKIRREVGHPSGQGKGHGHGHGHGQGQGHEHGKGHEQGHKCEHPIGKKPKHDKKKCKHNDNRESSEESHERYTTKPVLPMSANIPAHPKPASEAGVQKPGVLATTHYTEETTPLAAVIPMIPIIPVEKPGGLATTHYTEETTALAPVIPIIPILPVESEIPGLLPNLPEVLLPDLPEPPTPMCPGEPWKPKPLLPPSLSPTPEVLKDEDLLLGAHEETTLAIEKSRPALPSSSAAFGDDDLLAAFT